MAGGIVLVSFADTRPDKGTVAFYAANLDAARAAYTTYLRDGSNRTLEVESLSKKGKRQGLTLVDLRTVRYVTFAPKAASDEGDES